MSLEAPLSSPPPPPMGRTTTSLSMDSLKSSNTKKRSVIQALSGENISATPMNSHGSASSSTSTTKSLHSPEGALLLLLSPSKRLHLHSMSPNVNSPKMYLTSAKPGTSTCRPPIRRPKLYQQRSVLELSLEVELHRGSFSGSTTSTIFEDSVTHKTRPQQKRRVTTNGQLHHALSSSSTAASHTVTHATVPNTNKGLLLTRQIPNPRSQSSIALSSNNNNPLLLVSPTKLKLRRTTSLSGASSSSSSLFDSGTVSLTDRFIPSHHNSITSKLNNTNIIPQPNDSPVMHINAQTTKIHQNHVAQACGLQVNSRILQFQPLPPESKKPLSFSKKDKSLDEKSLGSSDDGTNRLKPAVASARAKKIPTAPERVLDAPGLVDDFYLNLIAWSSTNVLAIGLEDSVYLWHANTGDVVLLCEVPRGCAVSSLRWSEDGSYILIGRDDGLLEIWDVETTSKLRTLNCENHQTRIAAQAWLQHILTSGSRVGGLYHSDVRVASHLVAKNEQAHLAEVCGIEYRGDGQMVATGGNDNLVCIWDVRKTWSNSSPRQHLHQQQPVFSKTNHTAAVKAISWCPYQNNLLATGGGSSDKNIHFWNTGNGARVNTIETHLQISSLNWGYANGTGLEIVATHGFPTNNISLFNYPTLQKTGEIHQAHDFRILNGCLSPDGLTLATIAGDENLKFWSLFDLKRSIASKTDDDSSHNDVRKMLLR